MGSVKLKYAHWYLTKGRKILYCCGINYAKQFILNDKEGKFYLCGEHGHYNGDNEFGKILLELKNCDSFDWSPKIPEGFDALTIDEEIRYGDMYLKYDETLSPACDRLGASVNDALEDDIRTCGNVCFIIRKRPTTKYRPFKSAEEFAPHRDRWIQRTTQSGEKLPGAFKCVGYDDTGIYPEGGVRIGNDFSYESYFNRNVHFDDGEKERFGVKL